MSTVQSARSEQSADVRQLQNQIESIDSMCQVKLEQIIALTTTLLRAMETPNSGVSRTRCVTSSDSSSIPPMI